MVLRLIFILLGVAIISKFSFLLSIFGLILLYSGFKIFFNGNETEQFHDNFAVKILRKTIPVTNVLHGNKFFIRKNGNLFATPLFVALIIIEFSDVIFAIDSIPAIFSITTNAFIVYTSNIFAILGLRSMYYILQRMNNMFKFMKYGVGGILIFTGLKLVVIFFGIEISVTNSILIIVCILLGSVLLSLIFDGTKKKKERKLYH
jgi:tellurite resistance protein TerC